MSASTALTMRDVLQRHRARKEGGDDQSLVDVTKDKGAFVCGADEGHQGTGHAAPLPDDMKE